MNIHEIHSIPGDNREELTVQLAVLFYQVLAYRFVEKI